MRVPSKAKLIDSKERLVGLEFENPLVNQAGEPITRDVIQKIWKELMGSGWKGEVEPLSGNVLDVNKEYDFGNVNTSTDTSWSVFEVAMPPATSVAKALENYNHVMNDIHTVIHNAKARLLSTALVPGTMTDEDKYLTTKPFYRAFKYLYFHRLNCASSAHQVGVSISINEAITIANELSKILGLIVALTANGSVADFKILPWKDWRIVGWHFFAFTDFEGMEKLFNVPDHAFSSLADYFLYFWKETPRMFITPFRDGEFIVPDKPINWYDYLSGTGVAATSISGKKQRLVPNESDINMAMLAQWPYAKIHVVLDESKISVEDVLRAAEKNTLEEYISDKMTNIYVESRVGSPSLKREEMALPALTLGIINNMDRIKEFTKILNWQEWTELLNRASIHGLDFSFKDKKVIELADDLIGIAEEGLLQRRMREEKYLAPLKARVSEGKTPADLVNEQLKVNGKNGFLDFITY